MSKDEQLNSVGRNRAASLGRILMKKALAGLSHLFHILKGDISLFGARPLGIHEGQANSLEELSHTHEMTIG